MTTADRLRQRRERHRRRPLWVRAAVALGGFSTVGVGLALLVLPGPGLAFLVVGFGLLALEFRWAEAALARVLRHAGRVTPRKRSHRVAASAAAVAALAVSASAALLFGLPGF